MSDTALYDSERSLTDIYYIQKSVFIICTRYLYGLSVIDELYLKTMIL